MFLKIFNLQFTLIEDLKVNQRKHQLLFLKRNLNPTRATIQLHGLSLSQLKKISWLLRILQLDLLWLEKVTILKHSLLEPDCYSSQMRYINSVTLNSSWVFNHNKILMIGKLRDQNKTFLIKLLNLLLSLN